MVSVLNNIEGVLISNLEGYERYNNNVSFYEDILLVWIASTPINISTDLIISYSNGIAYVLIIFFKFTKNCSKDFKEIENFVNYENPTITKCSGYYSQTGDCWSSSENGYNNVFSKLKSTMAFKPVNEAFNSIYR